MHTFTGEALTPDALRVMKRLCKHWSHKYPVQVDDSEGVIQLGDVRVVMRATADRLSVRLENAVAEVPERLKGVVAEHLQRMAGAEVIDLQWQQGRGFSAATPAAGEV